jgi:hypothetical protein
MYIKACHADSPGGVILHLLPVPQNWEFTLVLTADIVIVQVDGKYL